MKTENSKRKNTYRTVLLLNSQNPRQTSAAQQPVSVNGIYFFNYRIGGWRDMDRRISGCGESYVFRLTCSVAATCS